MKSAMTSQMLVSAHNATLSESTRLMGGLGEIGTTDAEVIRQALANKSVEVGNLLGRGIAAGQQNIDARLAAKVASGDLKAMAIGGIAMVKLGAPELLSKLPSSTEVAVLAPDVLAEQIATVFEAERGDWPKVAAIIRTGITTFRAKEKAYQDAVTLQQTVRDTSAGISELKMMNLQARIFIQRNALPGTPAYATLTNPKKPSKKKAAKGETTPAGETKPETKSAESKSAETKPAEAKVEAPAANVVVPAASPTVLNGASHA